MSNLSPLGKWLRQLLIEIESIKRGGSKIEKKPHKLIMLLTVLELMEKGVIKENRIYYNDQLVSLFKDNFNIYGKDGDLCQAAPPFFHLKASAFWKHHIIPGREQVYNNLKTSGGGSRRILDNIEFAYLSDQAFELFSNPDTRSQIQNFIIDLLKRSDMDRLPTLFHESFSLSRPALLQILKAVQKISVGTTLKSKSKRELFFEANTDLGKNYIKSMPAYCKGSGLLDFEYGYTPFGKNCVIFDTHLEQLGTQWLMHYYLSATHGPGPAFWNEIISNFFYTGNIFASDVIAGAIGNFVWQAEGKVLAKRGVQSTATIFLGTYLKPEGLGKLRLLEETDSGRYRVREPVRPPKWAVACALVDYWAANYPGRLGIGLDTLQESNFLKIFMLGKNDFMDVLQAMQEVGYVNIHRAAPPYQVLLLRQDQEGLLQKLYGSD